MNVQPFLDQVVSWAATHPDVVGVALVGSHARGTPRADSDVDLVVLCAPSSGLLDEKWPAQFGEVESATVEDYGELTSLRLTYRSGLEVEFGVADRTWARTPLDPGTKHVLAGGVRVLYDPEQLFRVAVEAAVA